MKYSISSLWIGSLALLFMLPISASALEATGTLGTRTEHTNNVRSAAINEESDTIQVTYGEVGVEEVRKRFRADANIRLENEHYYKGSYEDETSLTSGFGLFTIDLVEDFLEWQATFSRTDVVSDSTEDENPDTREFRNIFRSGPSINYAISRITRFNLSGLYVHVVNSDEDADDNERIQGSARLSHQFNSLTTFNIASNYSDVLESDADDEITNVSYSAGFTRAYVDGQFALDYGVQEITSNIAEKETGTFADVSFTRESFLAHAWQFNFNQSISDTSIGFEDDEEGSRLDIDPTQSTSLTDIEKRDRATLSLTRDTNDFTYDLSLIYEESDFQVQAYVDRYRALTIGYQPKVYSRLIPRIEYEYGRQSYGVSPTRNAGLDSGEDITQTLTFSADYQMVPTVFLDGFIAYEDRANDVRASREYDEFSLGLGVRWEFL